MDMMRLAESTNPATGVLAASFATAARRLEEQHEQRLAERIVELLVTAWNAGQEG